MSTLLKGIIHGRSIELAQETGLPDGQEVAVEIKPIEAKQGAAQPAAPSWLARLDVDPGVRPGKFVVKGTHLLADDLVKCLEEGWSDDKLRRTYPELAAEDVAALHEYANLPVEMRRSFGAWADDSEELDKYLEWNRQQRKFSRQEIPD
jgi:uncharacterized protein (DUF433 family)